MADKALAEETRGATATQPASPTYIEKDGLKYAGTHLLLDFWGARSLDDEAAIRGVLAEAVRAIGATLVKVDLHRFDSGGVSGVAILAESHMSIHTWPETGYAAVDIFVCGSCDAYRAVPVLCDFFQPDRYNVSEHKRGLSP